MIILHLINQKKKKFRINNIKWNSIVFQDFLASDGLFNHKIEKKKINKKPTNIKWNSIVFQDFHSANSYQFIFGFYQINLSNWWKNNAKSETIWERIGQIFFW